MIALFSRWKFKQGCPPGLAAALEELVAAVRSQEPGTLVFSAHLPAAPPPIGPPPDYAVYNDPDLLRPANQNELVFFEVYRDEEAFSQHLKGSFYQFMAKHRDMFHTPWQGHPRPETTYLDPRSLFIRPDLARDGAGR